MTNTDKRSLREFLYGLLLAACWIGSMYISDIPSEKHKLQSITSDRLSCWRQYDGPWTCKVGYDEIVLPK